MTNEDFKGLFDGDDMDEIQAAAAKAEAEYEAQIQAAKAKGQDGLHYHSTEQDPNGHTVVRYAVRMSNKVVFWVLLDMDVTVAPPAQIPAEAIPAGLVFVRVQVQDASRSHAVETAGSIAAYPSTGGGYRAARNMLHAYVGPRIGRFVADLYGV